MKILSNVHNSECTHKVALLQTFLSLILPDPKRPSSDVIKMSETPDFYPLKLVAFDGSNIYSVAFYRLSL